VTVWATVNTDSVCVNVGVRSVDADNAKLREVMHSGRMTVMLSICVASLFRFVLITSAKWIVFSLACVCLSANRNIQQLLINSKKFCGIIEHNPGSN